ncbi:membrane protein [Sporolactobacillus inulinus]|uniref:Membrane protein n=1 Tax=Sporolactobacillus inulinus TaxID=2078 RepID=A0A4Y1ZA22_9BACL|nr:membrane protein [Sporolactobacillus inulinus]
MLPGVTIGELIKKLVIAVCAAFLCALSMNLFLVPAHVYAAGINGAAQLISDILLDSAHIHLSIGLLVLILNMPIALLGWFKVGKSFTLFSFITVVLTSFFLTVFAATPTVFRLAAQFYFWRHDFRDWSGGRTEIWDFDRWAGYHRDLFDAA